MAEQRGGHRSGPSPGSGLIAPGRRRISASVDPYFFLAGVGFGTDVQQTCASYVALGVPEA
jgi:hypothetical protein